MEGLFIVLTVFLAPLMALTILGGIVLAAIKIWRGNSLRQSKQNQAEETRLIQEIYQGLSRMEKRVEALETILLDHERKEKNDTDF